LVPKSLLRASQTSNQRQMPGEPPRPGPHSSAPKRHRRLSYSTQIIVRLGVAHKHIGIPRNLPHRIAQSGAVAANQF
jgi:hypothetical protein